MLIPLIVTYQYQSNFLISKGIGKLLTRLWFSRHTMTFFLSCFAAFYFFFVIIFLETTSLVRLHYIAMNKDLLIIY